VKEKKIEENKKERRLDTLRWGTMELKIKVKMKELEDINSKRNEVRKDGSTRGP